jgi:hypothetical protein
MTVTEATVIAGVVISLITSMVVPFILHRRAEARLRSDTNIVSWQSITSVLQKERDALREQLDEVRGETRRTIHQLDEEYAIQLLTARQRITQLESEVANVITSNRRQ